MAKTYAEKLLDPRWQKKRLERLEDAGWTCGQCGSDDKTLHVHHISYVKGREPWEYGLDELLVLCDGCHDQLHNDLDEIQHLLAQCHPAEARFVIGRLRMAAELGSTKRTRPISLDGPDMVDGALSRLMHRWPLHMILQVLVMQALQDGQIQCPQIWAIVNAAIEDHPVRKGAGTPR